MPVNPYYPPLSNLLTGLIELGFFFGNSSAVLSVCNPSGITNPFLLFFFSAFSESQPTLFRRVPPPGRDQER